MAKNKSHQPPADPPADPRVVHVSFELGREQPLGFGDGRVRVYASERPGDLDARLLLGMTTPEQVQKAMPLVATEDELRDLVKRVRAVFDGGEYLVRLSAFRTVFKGYRYAE